MESIRLRRVFQVPRMDEEEIHAYAPIERGVSSLDGSRRVSQSTHLDSMQRRQCLFCGASLTGTRSQEHVFPRWLLDEMGLRNKHVSAVHVFQPEDPDAPGELVSERALTLENMREGRICSGCNNGWMSQLEDRCRPILLALIQGRRRPEDLSEADCLPIAKWAAKTAYVLNSSANF